MTTVDASLDDYPAPRPAQGGAAARAGIMHATTLAVMVRDLEGPDTIGPYLDGLTRAQLYAAVVALAAMIDPDTDVVEERLAWLAEYGRDLERALSRVGMARRRAVA